MGRHLKDIEVTNVGEFFDSIKGLYLFHANWMQDNYNDYWELVAEAWICTRGMKDKNYASKAIKWAMLNYKCQKLKTYKRRTDKLKRCEQSLDELLKQGVI